MEQEPDYQDMCNHLLPNIADAINQYPEEVHCDLWMLMYKLMAIGFASISAGRAVQMFNHINKVIDAEIKELKGS
jgi:hypothetical protein